MSRYRISLLLMVVVLAVCSFSRWASAGGFDELKYLGMFYDEQDLVVTATRYPKPVFEVAENMEIITSEEIKKMNAHTVAEVLDRVSGLFLTNFTRDFGSASMIEIQGSDSRHVRVMVDGMTWNLISSGGVETHSIPVGMIERIEIVKGPGSSVWGSSLGGVIHIITKPPAAGKTPELSLRGSYGEGHSGDYRAQISGKAGNVGYLLWSGFQDSDGLLGERAFDSRSLVSKFELDLSDHVKASAILGYSNPEIVFFNDPVMNMTFSNEVDARFARASLNVDPDSNVKLKLACYQLDQETDFFTDRYDTGESIFSRRYDEKTQGIEGQLAWEKEHHTVVVGVDIESGELDQRADVSGVATSRTISDFSRWSVYTNDNIRLHPYAITLGVHYENDGVTGSFVSPSIGGTYQLDEHTIFRASISRGFMTPPLSWTSGVTLFDNYKPNPTLKPEKVWSFEAGLETRKFRYLYVKPTLFYHKAEDGIQFVRLPSNDYTPVNIETIRRRGIELELKTAPVHHLSLVTGGAYARIQASDTSAVEDKYSFFIGMRYEKPEGIYAELFGKYAYWNYENFKPGFVWDLNVNRTLWTRDRMRANFFATVHNLFDGSQYTIEVYRNPERWVEAGVRIEF